MRDKILSVFIAGLVICGFCGCSLLSPSVRESSYYDLNYNGSEKLDLPYNVSFRTIQNISPVKLNFVYSKNDGTMIIDQYNYWTQSPETMLRRYLLNAVNFKNSENAPQIAIVATIFEFEFDISNRRCVLGVRCVFESSDKDGKIDKVYIVETPVNSLDRVELVKGMNKCAEQFTRQVVNDIKKIK